jgi:hypothetical protein
MHKESWGHRELTLRLTPATTSPVEQARQAPPLQAHMPMCSSRPPGKYARLRMAMPSSMDMRCSRMIFHMPTMASSPHTYSCSPAFRGRGTHAHKTGWNP